MKGEKTSSAVMSERPAGVTALVIFHILLAAAGLYVALDQYLDPFTFEGQEYTMWSMRTGPYVVVYLVGIICAAVMLYRGNQMGRIGIIALTALVPVYFVYGVFETVAWREHPESLVAWWYGVLVAAVATLWVASSIWYLFSGRRNNWFRHFNVHA